MLKRPDVGASGPGGAGGDRPLSASMDAVTYPFLFEYLTAERWDDGQARETSTLLWFTEAGILKVCLNDRATGRVVFLACESFQAALAALEHGLATDTLAWRAKAQGKPGKRR